jgi:hypothetical protein
MSTRIPWSLAATVLLLLAFASPAAAAAAPETPGATFAASAAAGGELADGAGAVESAPLQISEDGRYVSFQSASQNLGGAGPEGATEGFVKDLETGTVELVSRADGIGGEAAAAPGITTLQLSGNGRYALFTSAATNLGTALPEEVAGETHVYRRDLATGETTLVDRVSGAGGQLLARGAEGDAISADGQVVAFTDRVANLEDPLGDHTETAEPVGYVRNLETGTTTAVSRADGAAGELADRGAEFLSLSPDGRYVGFISSADNIGSGTENYFTYVRDTVEDTTTLISQNAAGEVADASAYGELSGGAGCFGTMETDATNLTTPPLVLAGSSQVYLFDRCAPTGTFSLISLQADGSQFYFSVGSFQASTVNADGTEALFKGSTNGSCGCHLYLRDLAAGTTTGVDLASGAGGELADAETQNFALSANGCRAVFATRATNLVAQAAPGVAEELEPTELYVRQLAPCHPQVAQPPAGGSPAPSPGAPVTLGATKVGLGHLSRKALWLSFDGPGQARVRIQRLRGGRHHGWRQVKALTVTASAAGSVKVKLPALGAGRYRFKARLQGDPDAPTLTRKLTVAGHP